MKDKYALKNWQDLPYGGVITEGGNARDYETGTWRTWRPVWNQEACIHCLTCWVLCPEDAYQLRDGKTKNGKDRQEICGINYYHCKGCGLCVKECPVNKNQKNDKTPLDFVREET
jgi:pyruvate ferredoxin oxidoreductase delta subunit